MSELLSRLVVDLWVVAVVAVVVCCWLVMMFDRWWCWSCVFWLFVVDCAIWTELEIEWCTTGFHAVLSMIRLCSFLSFL